MGALTSLIIEAFYAFETDAARVVWRLNFLFFVLLFSAQRKTKRVSA